MSVLGILQCDSVRPELQATHGDYPAMFQRLLGPLAPDAGFRVYAAHQGRLPAHPRECDGYLITGSKAGVYDDEPWIAPLMAFVRELLRSRVRTVGICFGHQLIAQALGGQAAKSERGWGVGVRRSQVVRPRAWMRPKLDAFDLIYSHQDQVVALPPKGLCLAGDDFCPVSMFEVDDVMLGCQGHPEFRPEYAAELLALRRPMIGAERADRALATLAGRRDHGAVARWLLAFLRIGPLSGHEE